MENYKFISNRDCEYFPCHNVEDDSEFNCLFCYCPLYTLGENCGGNYKYLENGVKSCEDCMIPHKKDAYDHIAKRFPHIKELAGRKIPE